MPSQIEFEFPWLTGLLTTPDQEWVCKPPLKPVHEERFSQASNQHEPIDEVASPTTDFAKIIWGCLKMRRPFHPLKVYTFLTKKGRFILRNTHIMKTKSNPSCHILILILHHKYKL